MGVFINGLEEELQSDVKIQKPRTVYKAASLALEFEAKVMTQHSSRLPQRTNVSLGSEGVSNFRDSRNNFQRQFVTPFSSTSQAVTHNSNFQKQLPLAISNNNQVASASSTTAESDRQFRRDKGLCYKCGDKFIPGHRCKQSSLKLIEITKEVDNNPVLENDATPTFEMELAEISFHAILGSSSSTTMKLKGLLCSKPVLILMDSGSTHNFVSHKLVTELNLSTTQIPPFGVQVGNGNVVACNSICKQLMVQVDGRRYKLQGIPQQQMTASLHSISCHDGPTSSEEYLQYLLQSYASVFDEPRELPPLREQNHTIPLYPGSTPPNIQRYRYPHSQKDEIERQVVDF